MILEFASLATGSFKFARANIVYRAPSGGSVLLRCRLIRFEPEDLFERINYSNLYESAQNFLEDPEDEASDQEHVNGDQGGDVGGTVISMGYVPGPGNIFDVWVDRTLGIMSCLYSNVMVPDVISRVCGGTCSMCSSRRALCPGCTGGRSDSFGVFSSCGVELACPVCLGIYLSLDHKWYLESYFFGNGPSHLGERAMEQKIIDRLTELGYAADEYMDMFRRGGL